MSFGPRASGLETAHVRIASHGFEPHRHDTFGIGMTTGGVQTFRYRGERWVSLPGQLHVLHPDETHDGNSGTEEGFAYRILYVGPELIHQALDSAELPFVANPIPDPRTPARQRLASLLHRPDDPISDLACADIAATIADALRDLSGRPSRRPTPLDAPAVETVREYLAAHACEQTPASTLERISGLDRFTMARQFRRAFGTSPDRYRTARRLAAARTAIEAGIPLAQAAVACGFADQSHFTRQFKRTYGLTPARWVKAVTGGQAAMRFSAAW